MQMQESLDKAIEIEPQHAMAWNSKGIAFGSQGKYNEALQAFDKAVEINSQLKDGLDQQRQCSQAARSRCRSQCSLCQSPGAGAYGLIYGVF
jgi:tetratricopeptide (TPR) repeat protein